MNAVTMYLLFVVAVAKMNMNPGVSIDDRLEGPIQHAESQDVACEERKRSEKVTPKVPVNLFGVVGLHTGLLGLAVYGGEGFSFLLHERARHGRRRCGLRMCLAMREVKKEVNVSFHEAATFLSGESSQRPVIFRTIQRPKARHVEDTKKKDSWKIYATVGVFQTFRFFEITFAEPTHGW